MSGFFTLFIGVAVGVENFTWIKLGALVISFRPTLYKLMLGLQGYPSFLYRTQRQRARLPRRETCCFWAMPFLYSEQPFMAVTPLYSNYAFNMKVE
jgi:hypothetical protein